MYIPNVLTNYWYCVSTEAGCSWYFLILIYFIHIEKLSCQFSSQLDYLCILISPCWYSFLQNLDNTLNYHLQPISYFLEICWTILIKKHKIYIWVRVCALIWAIWIITLFLTNQELFLFYRLSDPFGHAPDLYVVISRTQDTDTGCNHP
jgi:hypothetical protein